MATKPRTHGTPEPATRRHSRWHRPLLAVVLAMSFVVPPGAGADRPAQAEPDAGEPEEVIISHQDEIEHWLIGGGADYWYDNCIRTDNDSEAFLRRRGAEESFFGTLDTIDDPDTCRTYLSAAADESGFYYYDEPTESIEAYYADSFVKAVLGEIGRLRLHELSDLALGDDHVYWVESDPEELLPDQVHIRRMDKDGGDAETLLSYEGTARFPDLAVGEGWVLWTDDDGLQGTHLASCNGSCDRTHLHEAPTRRSTVAFTETGDFFWKNLDSPGETAPRVYRTRCSADGCETDHLYTAPDPMRIRSLAAGAGHVFWLESPSNDADGRIMRMEAGGGTAEIVREDAYAGTTIDPGRLDVDTEGLYYQSLDRMRVLRIPVDAPAIVREITFRGWEVTQAVQNVESNDVPLVAGKDTYVRLYAEVDGPDAAGVQALLHGERDGTPLPGSPLRPLNGAIPVNDDDSLGDQRSDPDSGWLFRLPSSWTKTSDAAIPLEDADVDLRAEIDPQGAIAPTAPADTAEGTFTLVAKAPTCIETHEVRTATARQRSWDDTVANVFDLSESVHPTVGFLPFPKEGSLERPVFCRKGLAYGPFCKGPYDLDNTWHRTQLMAKLVRKNQLGSTPSVCIDTGARKLTGGIVHPDAEWEKSGYALHRGPVPSAFLSKVPHYGRWSRPLNRDVGHAMTLVHEVGHNYRRRHVDCGGPDTLDHDYPYDPCTLDDGDPDSGSTHFGFDTRFREPVYPGLVGGDPHNRDYMAYGSPRWVSDYTWRALFDRTRPPEPIVPPLSPSAAGGPDAYLLISGGVSMTEPDGELNATWRYPTADAGADLVATWEAETAQPRDGERFHVRLLDADGDVLADVAAGLPDGFTADGSLDLPLNLVIPEPEGTVARIELLDDGTVLDGFSPHANAPEVNVLAPSGGEVADESVTVEWEATDPDDVPFLEYTVQYSPDLGETWQVVLADEAGVGDGIVERRTADLRGQPSSGQDTALLRVLASDGYNTGIATSEPFTVTARGPRVAITSPGDDERFEAGDAVVLDGHALHPDLGALGDDAFTWTVAGREITARDAVLHGLAPGEHTATLRATDPEGLSDTATVDFEVAPLVVQRTSEPNLDGRCDDTAYGGTSLELSPYDDGGAAYASVVHTSEGLWVCLQGLEGAGEHAGFTIDTDNSQASTVQGSDLGFFVRDDGTLSALEGAETDGLAAEVDAAGETWSAELQVDAEAAGGWDQRVALAFVHELDDDLSAWPHAAGLADPRSWAQAILGTDELPGITAISPEETTVAESFELTVTGTGFDADTGIVFDGTAVDTDPVDDDALQATVDAGLIPEAGLYAVQVAPDGDPSLATDPISLLVSNPRPEISALSPDAALEGGDAFTLTVEGEGFVDGATVSWDGDPRPTDFLGADRLEAQIGSEDLAFAGSAAVTVANPDPSAGVSEPVTFTVERSGPPFRTESSVHHFDPFGRHVPGARAHLDANRNGVTMRLDTSELPPRHGITVWWVIFNNPQACAGEGFCTLDDLVNNTEAVGGEVVYAAGNFTGGHGEAGFAARLNAGHHDGEWFGNGFTNPLGAEIHLIVRSHGERIPRMADEQIRTYRGGCDNVSDDHPAADDGRRGPNTCEDIQFARFRQ